MNDDEIRALVRVAIQKHLGAPAVNDRVDDRRGGPSGPPVVPISFGRYALPRAEDDTMCLIEPAVRCNHCGYCECHGH